MKKGGVTIFIILGIIILMSVGLLVSLSRNSPDVDVKDDDYSGYNANEVKAKVEKCLFQSSIKGLELLGKQGGVIYKSQGGSVSDSQGIYYSYEYDDYQLWKGILAGSYSGSRKICRPYWNIEDPESCPSAGFPFWDTESPLVTFQQLPIGVNPSYPEWVRLFSDPNYFDLYPQNSHFYEISATSGFLADNELNNIYMFFKEFLENNITACLDFSEFESSRISVIPQGEIEIDPIISDEYVYVSMTYPLKIMRDDMPLMYFEQFNIETKVRLKDVFRFYKEIIEEEALNYSFDIGAHDVSAPTGITSMLIPVTDDKTHFVLEITDTKSLIPTDSGFEPFVFRSAIENSQPAISFIHSQNLNVVPGLLDGIRACPFLAENPYEDFSSMHIGVGNTIGKKEIECLWYVYERLLSGTGYKPMYDPDEDDITDWKYKISRCNDDMPCKLIREDYSKENFVVIKTEDYQYEDKLNFSFVLFNHGPEIVEAFDVIPPIMDEAPGLMAILLSLPTMPGIWIVGAYDQDIRFGDDVDYLELSVSYPTSANVEEIIIENGEVTIPMIPTPIPVDSIEGLEESENMTFWSVTFQNPTGAYATFTVKDSYGNTTSIDERVS